MKRLLLSLLTLVGSSIGAVSITGTAHAQVTAENFEVMLVVDTSGSMRGQAIEQTKAAAVDFINQMPPNVRIGLVSFGETVSAPTAPSTDRALLSQEISALVAESHHTLLYDGVITAVQAYTPAAANKALVVLSDGRDSGSANSLQAAVAAVQGAHVETISLTTPETDLAALQALGTVTAAEDPGALSAAFARVADLLTKVVATTLPPTTAAPATTGVPTTVPVTTVAPATTVSPTTSVYSRPAPSAEALESSKSSFPWVPALAVFGSLVALVLLVWPRQRVSRARLGIQQPKRMSEMGQRTMSMFEEMARKGDLADNLSVANIGIKPGEFVAVVAVIAIVVGLVGLILGGLLLAVTFAVVVCLSARFHVQRKKAKRRRAFADQLPDVLQLVTTSLRSGYGITQALAFVAEEAEEPARSEFAHVLTETSLGRDLSEALRALAVRMDSLDLEWVVGAIDINRDTGGNLSETLGKVSNTIRERERMQRQVLTLTAEGRLSARILTGLPFLMGLWQWRTNPDAFSLLFHGFGLFVLLCGAFLLLIGGFWMRRIVKSISL
jgi:tight adherence protein B